MNSVATTNSTAEQLKEMREHPAYKLMDQYVIDFDLRNYKVKCYQTSSDAAKALLLYELLEFLKGGDKNE